MHRGQRSRKKKNYKNFLKNDRIILRQTAPGSTVPTCGETATGTPSGITNSKDVGQTGAIGPEMQHQQFNN